MIHAVVKSARYYQLAVIVQDRGGEEKHNRIMQQVCRHCLKFLMAWHRSRTVGRALWVTLHCSIQAVYQKHDWIQVWITFVILGSHLQGVRCIGGLAMKQKRMCTIVRVVTSIYVCVATEFFTLFPILYRWGIHLKKGTKRKIKLNDVLRLIESINLCFSHVLLHYYIIINVKTGLFLLIFWPKSTRQMNFLTIFFHEVWTHAT